MTPTDTIGDDVRLYRGDCLTVLPTLAGIDAVVTDPPFGMDWDTDSTRFTGGKGGHTKKTRRIANDDKPFDPSPWLKFPRVLLWGHNHYAAMLPIGTTLVWVKKSVDKFGAFLSDAEIGWSKGSHGVYCFWHIWDGCARESESGTHYHPTQKPLALMRWAMDRLQIPPGATVLDPYMGSGTTGVACMQTGRKFVGIELDPAHYETAHKRLVTATGMGPGQLFGGAA